MKATLGFLLSLALTLLEPLGPQVALEEVGSTVLPSGFRPVGIATGQENIFVWGAAEGTFVAVHEGWHVTEHRLEADRIRAVAWDGRYWQILTALGEALTLSASFEVLAREKIFKETELPLQATAQWYQGKWRILRIGPDGILLLDGTRIVGSAGLDASLRPADRLWVRRTGNHWLVSRLFPPFWSATMDPAHSRVLTVLCGRRHRNKNGTHIPLGVRGRRGEHAPPVGPPQPRSDRVGRVHLARWQLGDSGHRHHIRPHSGSASRSSAFREARLPSAPQMVD